MILLKEFCNGMMDPWDWYICPFVFVYSCFFPGVFVYRWLYIHIFAYIYIFHLPWILWQIYLFMVSYGCHTRVIMSSSSAWKSSFAKVLTSIPVKTSLKHGGWDMLVPWRVITFAYIYIYIGILLHGLKPPSLSPLLAPGGELRRWDDWDLWILADVAAS